jgi:hypothetical protein
MTMDEIVSVLVARYRPLAKQLGTSGRERLENMLDILETNSHDWPVDKTHRWIGFIQGALWVSDLIDVDEERNFTRPLFHQFYRKLGLEIPDSVDVMNSDLSR